MSRFDIRRRKRGPGFCRENLIVANTGLGRWIGGDYVGSYITLTTPPCMYKETWRVKLNTFALTTVAGAALISERSTSNSNIYCALLVDPANPSKIKVFFRNALGVEIVSATHTTAIKPFTVNKPVIFERIGGTIYCTQGVVTEAIKTGLVGEIEDGSNYDSRLIGATWTGSGIISDYSGDIWGVEICDVKIPINEGAGTVIHDSNGNVVGTLTDPTGKYWKSRIDAINIDGPHMTMTELTSFSSGRQIAWFDEDYIQSMLSCLAGNDILIFEDNIYGSSSAATSSAIYTEYFGTYGLSGRTLLIYKSGIKLVFRVYTSPGGSFREKTHSVDVFTNSGHNIKINKAAASTDININIDGTVETLDFSGLTPATSDRCEIGRQNSVGLETTAGMYDLLICETLLRLDEQSGTEVFDSEGNKVGDLVLGSPDTYFDKWLKNSDKSIIPRPLIIVNPEDNADILAQTGLTSADELTKEGYEALNDNSKIFINQDTGMRTLIHSVAQTGTCLTRSVRWVGNNI